MRKAPLFLMLLSGVVWMTDAEAKNRDKSWELAAMVNHVDGDRTADVDNGIGPAILVGYNFSAKVEAELKVGLVSTEVGSIDADFVRAYVSVTGNFFTDYETRTIPYLSAGLGVIQETRESFEDPGTGATVPEAFDSSALLTLAVGARTFFTENWGVRYEARYNHHDSFDLGQDEYVLGVGVTWILGGEK